VVLGVANFFRVLVEVYAPVWLLVAPQKTFHEFAASTAFADGPLLWATGLVLVMGVTTLAMARRSPVALFALLWIVVAFGPVTQIIPIPDPVGERMVYVPQIGLALLIASAAQGLRGRLGGPLRPMVKGVVGGALVLVLVVACWNRHRDWTSNTQLNIANFEGDAKPTPFGRRNLAALYLMRAKPGDFAAADALLAENERVGVVESEGLRLRAVCALAAGDLPGAERRAREAVRLDEGNALAYRVLAAVRKAQGAAAEEVAALQARAAQLERERGRRGYEGNRRQFGQK